MTGKIYFQWQNPVLRKTIYPKRDLKLRHFLLYYKEIDLWAEHKNKRIEKLSKEREEFVKAQQAVIAEAYKAEQGWRTQFLESKPPSVPSIDSPAGKVEVAKLEKLLLNLYDSFKTYFIQYMNEPEETRDKKEKYFINNRVETWENERKILIQKIAKKNSLLKDPNVIDTDGKTRELEDFKTVLSALELELGKLKEFAAAQAKLEKRKAEFAKKVKENSEKEADILRVLAPLEKQIATREAEREKLTATIARLTNPPKIADVLSYFSTNLYGKIQSRFGEGEWKWEQPVVDKIIVSVREAFGDVIESLEKEILPFIHKSDPNWLRQLIKNQHEKAKNAQKQLNKVILKLDVEIKTLNHLQEEKKKSLAEDSHELRTLEGKKKICQNASNILSGVAMKEILENELGKLEDLQIAIEYLGQKDKTRWDEEKIKPQQVALDKCEKEILKAKKKLQEDGLREKLAPITSALEIGREKFLSEYVPDEPVTVNDIVIHLAEKEKARLERLTSDQLLLEVFQRFWNEPERFPLWLQYMVIHFSGMRYASAHDSWYDPRVLLLDLWTMDVQEGLKNKDDDPSNDTNYDIDDLTDAQVLEKLKTYKDQLPKWMWKEIVEVTDLRLTEVTNPDEDWENLSPAEQKERNSARDKKTGQYLKIMEKWKKDNLTGWRKEHDRANRLIVTRAVCNEVAEHIQHLRGHEGAAGLAEKPNWYMGTESRYYESKERKAGSRPYFVKAKSRNDFEVGASILWLRFVHESPDQWRIAKPLETRAGDGLIPQAYLGRSLDSGGWAYKMGEPIMRTRMKISTDNKKGSSKGSRGGKENQWLRWMHEATVVEVAETAETKGENRAVLTFETNLPDEDRNTATIGLFKRYLSDLTREQVEDSYNAAFVGFMPEAELPTAAAAGLAADMEVMLDWNHILQKEAVPAAELEAYRNKYIRNRKPPKPTIQIIDPVEREKGKADLPICDFAKWTDSLITKENNLWKVRIWGDPNLNGADVQLVDTTNFQAVGVYVKEIGQRGGVTNFIKIERGEIDKLIAMQVEDDFIQKRSSRKRPKFWLEQKMNWLCKGEGTVYWEEGGKGWEKAPFISWGTIALGGNLVQVEGEEEIEFKTEDGKKKLRMARLAGFKKFHWSWPLDKLLAEGLVHRCFCAYSGNKPRDTPKGIVYSPFFSPQDRDFSGKSKPSAFYLPFDQLVKPDEEENYIGIRQRLKCRDEE